MGGVGLVRRTLGWKAPVKVETRYWSTEIAVGTLGSLSVALLPRRTRPKVPNSFRLADRRRQRHRRPLPRGKRHAFWIARSRTWRTDRAWTEGSRGIEGQKSRELSRRPLRGQGGLALFPTISDPGRDRSPDEHNVNASRYLTCGFHSLCYCLPRQLKTVNAPLQPRPISHHPHLARAPRWIWARREPCFYHFSWRHTWPGQHA
jgi:hypothetical protein